MHFPFGSQVEAAKEATEKLQPRIVKINRAPTLTLWVKVVAEREGSAFRPLWLPDCSINHLWGNHHIFKCDKCQMIESCSNMSFRK